MKGLSGLKYTFVISYQKINFISFQPIARSFQFFKMKNLWSYLSMTTSAVIGTLSKCCGVSYVSLLLPVWFMFEETHDP